VNTRAHHGTAMLAPHLPDVILPQSDFANAAGAVETIASDFSQNPACGADRSECVRVFIAAQNDFRRQTMQKGTVKWFNPTKGYGFIRPSSGDKDVFVHISAVERAGLSSLNEGQVVEYELVTNRGRTSAENLKVA
jgi:cold shock protein